MKGAARKSQKTIIIQSKAIARQISSRTFISILRMGLAGALKSIEPLVKESR